MRLVSTRNPKELASFSQAAQRTLAPDGGLYVPEPIPCFRDIAQLLAMDFQSRSVEILHRFLGDEFTRDELEAVVWDAFDFPVPAVRVRERVFALELFHGPTFSVKDFGARFLARMLALVGAKEGFKLRTILVAGSGDAGAAVAHAFWRRKGFRVVLLYPKGRISTVHEQQMTALGDNVLCYAVEGSADDCQALAHTAFQDEALVKSLGLSGASSLNIACILAQIPYFFEASAQLHASDRRDAPVVSVPCGHFGQLYSGLLAQRTGLPVKCFVIATNANRTVPDYLEGGEYRPRPSIETLSNALDVGEPESWERVQTLFPGSLGALRSTFRWGSIDDASTRRAMWELHGSGCIPEPYGSTAFHIMEEHRGLNETGIFLATSHPAKFKDFLSLQMNLKVELPQTLTELQDKPLQVRTLPNSFAALKAKLLG